MKYISAFDVSNRGISCLGFNLKQSRINEEYLLINTKYEGCGTYGEFPFATKLDE